MPLSRRTLIKLSALVAAQPLFSACAKIPPSKGMALDSDWQQADSIRANIVEPVFPPKDFNILDFGALAGAEHDCTAAIAKTITACNQQGGGRVLIPAGTYFTGPIVLLSNVNLHLQKGATLKFIPEPDRYLPPVLTRWEGLELMGYSPLVYAHEQKNIAVTGEGTLDGSGDNEIWWPWKGEHEDRHWILIDGEDQQPARDKLIADAENNVPVEQRIYADGAFLRPPLFQPYSCDNVLVEGITIKDSPFWLINPVLCNSVTVRDVTMDSHGPNSDGCNPESCDHVLIEGCYFNTGDDCIAIKSGRNADGRRINVPSQNIVIANCKMQDGHGGVVIGSEISGGVNNVFVENCEMNSPLLERAIRIKTNSVRGGLIEHLRYRNIDVGDVKNAFVVNFYYEEGDAGKFDPTVRDIVIENFHCNNVIHKALNLQGFERAPMSDITLRNCHFDKVGEASIVKNVNNFVLDNVSIEGNVVNVDELVNS
ncbi:Polygalacturonase [Alteromonadaceae bacterium Bs31]|nr:Polygalacturonase [Alteromonadaceae bacterium Bs31]